MARCPTPGPVPRSPRARNRLRLPISPSKHRLRFWTKGDGQTYRVMFFTSAGGFRPFTTTFVAPPAWTEVVVALTSVPRLTTNNITGIMFAGGPAPGPFAFVIDELRLE